MFHSGRGCLIVIRMDTKALIGARIKELRRSRNHSQEALAEIVGISPKYLSSIERGKENPTLDMMIKLAAALEVEIELLFTIGHHGKTEKELRATIASTLKGSDAATLALVTKIVRAICR